MLTPWKKSYDQSATAAAKSLQSCLTLCDPIDGSQPGYAIPGVLQARTLEWVATVNNHVNNLTNLDSILKGRDITLTLLVKAMVFQQSCMAVRVGP